MGRDLLASRELAWRLMVRNISAQYRQSILGVAWAVLPAVLTAAIFTAASSAKVVNLGTTDLPYPAYVAFSMTLWQTFVEALQGPSMAVASSKGMMAKINFPREAIILAKLGEVLFNFSIKLILIVLIFLVFRIPVGWSALLAPVGLIHMVMLGTAVGLLIAPMGGLYQDFNKGITLASTVWMFATPVLYAKPFTGTFAEVVKYNPVTPLLITTRELATTGIISNPQGFWISSALAFFGLLLAWLVYRLSMPFVIERISS
ncbi:ABC transporter permease [Leptolyngbya sp. FACHB-261]|nr:ABC transporter permease [Leptolyngbya sp. FACHB-261]